MYKLKNNIQLFFKGKTNPGGDLEIWSTRCIQEVIWHLTTTCFLPTVCFTLSLKKDLTYGILFGCVLQGLDDVQLVPPPHAFHFLWFDISIFLTTTKKMSQQKVSITPAFKSGFKWCQSDFCGRTRGQLDVYLIRLSDKVTDVYSLSWFVIAAHRGLLDSGRQGTVFIRHAVKKPTFNKHMQKTKQNWLFDEKSWNCAKPNGATFQLKITRIQESTFLHRTL